VTFDVSGNVIFVRRSHNSDNNSDIHNLCTVLSAQYQSYYTTQKGICVWFSCNLQSVGIYDLLASLPVV
jgi:hypothetical protein